VFDTTGKLVFNGSPHDDNFERAVKKALRDIKEVKK
jgi:TATA-box binding protein (TBP) (component of TFIID and TFIIIB)